MARPWRIVINGEGPSRNDRPDDADAIAKQFLPFFGEAGHTIKVAVIQDDTGKSYPLTLQSLSVQVAEEIKELRAARGDAPDLGRELEEQISAASVADSIKKPDAPKVAGAQKDKPAK